METKSRRLKRRDDALPSLDTAIGVLDLARAGTNVTPEIKGLLGSASILLNTIKVCLLLVHVRRLLADVRRTRWSTKRIMWN